MRRRFEMYPTTGTATEDKPIYNFHAEENTNKWKGLLVNALQKVQRQVHPSLTAKEDALHYIEDLLLKHLGTLCSYQPHSVADVEDRVQKTFPHPIDKWAIGDAQAALEKGKKKSPLVLPVDKIHPLLIKEVLGYKVDYQVTIYIVAVLEYIAADILKLTGNYVKNIKHQEISLQDIKVAMCADKVLIDMFFQDDDDALNMEEEPVYVRRKSLTYEEIVKDLLLEENQYMRDLNMIIKVFRSPFVKLYPRSKDLEVIFGNILDVMELTANLLSSLEDTVEMTEENGVPLVGSCFEELAEGAEFDVYEKYAEDILKPNGRDRLYTLLQRCDASHALKSQGGRLFQDAVKYVLPKLLLGPIYHCLHYSDVIKALIDTTEEEEDKESLEQALSLLHPMKLEIERTGGASLLKRKNTGWDSTLRFNGRAGRGAALYKMNELQKSLDGWEGKNIGQSCNEFIMEGTLCKYAGKRQTERYVFMFDGLIIFTKQNTKRSSVTGPVGDYKFKEKFNMRKIDVVDKDDVEELKNAFELQVRDHPSITLVAKSAEEKCNWMAALVSLLTRSYLERKLDSILKEEEKNQPLRLPTPEQYRFAVDDSSENIVFEDNQDQHQDCPLIKGGTLVKLVERLTYHMYADPKFVRTFLTTYRTFCVLEELLDLLVERFEIPDPPISVDSDDPNDMAALMAREDLKKFRKKYSKPVQFRVLNVLRHWVDQHWYDFVWNQELLIKLNNFLESVKGKAMRKWVESINKVIFRKIESDGLEKIKQITYQSEPPPIEWHITRKLEDFDLMTLHPIEIARQVTLLEFDLFRAVKSSEMVGSVWVKKKKSVTSPNLLKMINHSTKFTFWLEKCIAEAENFEERVMVVSRILEIMMVFQELNNFNGILEVVSALNSAPVYRMEHTFEEVDQKFHKLMKAFDEAKELNSDHFKRYILKLRSINPPCVPFLGMYLTNILHTEEGNPDFLPNRPEGIINFSKRRKVAEITGEIQQYQNQPYCFRVQQDIRSFFENLNPLGDQLEKDFSDYLYEKSMELEQRNSKAPTRYDRKREYSLKSPGIKPMSSRHSTSNLKSEKSHPTSLSSNTLSRVHEEGQGDVEPLLSSCGNTPPTPGTPLTPQHDSSNVSVFAPVMLPDTSSSLVSNSPSLTGSVISLHFPPPGHGSVGNLHHPSPPLLQPVQTPLQPPPAREDIPPPLPPRPRKRESSIGGRELSPIQQSPEPPELPPRDTAAPPLPPRQATTTHSTLPRHSVPTYDPNSPSMVMTFPRRMSEREAEPRTEHLHVNTMMTTTPMMATSMNVNGDRSGSVTPELPPKTYRASSSSTFHSSSHHTAS